MKVPTPKGRQGTVRRGFEHTVTAKDAGGQGHQAHALRVLEFERVIERVAGRAASVPGRAKVIALRPISCSDDVRQELARVGAVMDLLGERPGWDLPAVPREAMKVAQAKIDGAMLDPLALRAIGDALLASRSLASALGKWKSPSELGTILARLVALPAVERALDHAIAPQGEVLDRASPELRRIRSRVRTVTERIMERMTTFAHRLPKHLAVPGSSVSLRDGRYVIAVRREGKREIGGIVHDESRSGATLFIEPPVAIEVTNELRALERAIERETNRILRELTARLAPHVDDILGALDSLAEFDSLTARARTAMAWKATLPDLASEGPFHVIDGCHPLLAEGDRLAVPFTFSFEDGERVVVVSGPNAGGKSVFLKAAGLACVLAQSGVAPPVGAGTRLPIFNSFFADIGDEQSITHSLSTFSAHLANIAEVVEHADQRSLVLLDELGTGTDPREGAALARAVLEELASRGATVMASSHLGELKRLATPGSGIVNASLEFDEERMQPTYHLVKGRPGRSYGLALADSAGLPSGVIERARAYLGEKEVELDEILASLRRREREVDELADGLRSQRKRLDGLASELADREEGIRAYERVALEKARREARSTLMAARGEVEAVIRDLRSEARERADLNAAVRSARARVEAGARRHHPNEGSDQATLAATLPEGTVPLRQRDLSRLVKGQELMLRANARRVRFLSLQSGRVVVELGGVRLNLAAGALALPKALLRALPQGAEDPQATDLPNGALPTRAARSPKGAPPTRSTTPKQRAASRRP